MRSSVLLLALCSLPASASGSLQGVVKVSGKVPAPAAESHASDPACGADGKDESILVTAGKVANVVVRVLDAPAAPPSAAAASEPVHIQQTHCAYRPRVQTALEGQKIRVQNEDPAMHNVHAYNGSKGLFNVAQPPGSPAIEKSAPPGVALVKVKCDVHPWMTAWVAYGKTPFAAVTAANGSYVIKNLPPGTYQVEAWHEKLGKVTQSVTVKDGKATPLSFELKAP